MATVRACMNRWMHDERLRSSVRDRVQGTKRNYKNTPAYRDDITFYTQRLLLPSPTTTLSLTTCLST